MRIVNHFHFFIRVEAHHYVETGLGDAFLTIETMSYDDDLRPRQLMEAA